MFDELKSLTEELFAADANFSNYNNAKKARELLQKIRVLTFNLRKEVTAEFKKSKK